MTSQVPAIVLGNFVTALGVIRALGSRGIPLYWVTEKPDFVRGSRWSRRFPAEVRPPSGPGDLAAFLHRVPVHRAVLIPCSDHWNTATAALDPELAARFPTSLPTAATMDLLMDKGRLAATLVDQGIPHPRSVLLEDEADLDIAPPGEIDNWFIKPCDSQGFRGHFGRKALRVTSPEDARQKFRAVQEAGFAAIFQEYIPGPASRHFFVDGFVDAQGDLKVCFARQRIRIYPPDFGDSSYLTSVSPAAAADAIASVGSLLQAVPYRGIFSVEFKHDRRDGRFKLIEVNTRPWVYVQFAAECGVDVVDMAYRDALGEPVAAVHDYRVGHSTASRPSDWKAALAAIRRGELGPATWLWSDLRASSSVFRWDDPLPLFLEWAGMVRAKLEKKQG